MTNQAFNQGATCYWNGGSLAMNPYGYKNHRYQALQWSNGFAEAMDADRYSLPLYHVEHLDHADSTIVR